MFYIHGRFILGIFILVFVSACVEVDCSSPSIECVDPSAEETDTSVANPCLDQQSVNCGNTSDQTTTDDQSLPAMGQGSEMVVGGEQQSSPDQIPTTPDSDQTGSADSVIIPDTNIEIPVDIIVDTGSSTVGSGQGSLPDPTVIETPVITPEVPVNQQPTTKPYLTEALNMADFLLSLQTAEGTIPDSPGSPIANEDSNMEYALIGLAAAYWQTGDGRYLQGLEKGIQWLAERQDMSQSFWRGSWYYTYQSFFPYAPVATSPGGGVNDVRGVDATSALFVYLLYLHKALSGRSDLVSQYADNAIAALTFLINNNGDPASPFYFSSWQQRNSQWELWRFQYSADQGDVYLGLAAASQLFEPAGVGDYTLAATRLKTVYRP